MATNALDEPLVFKTLRAPAPGEWTETWELFSDAHPQQVIGLYESLLTGRKLIASQRMPAELLTLQPPFPMTRAEAIDAIEMLWALQGFKVEVEGDDDFRFVTGPQ